MGLLDKVKGMFGGNKQQTSAMVAKANDAVDKGADVVKDKTPDQHDDKVDMAADKTKDVIDKLDD